jgi:phosphoglycerate dehydrogenase-like enzyme
MTETTILMPTHVMERIGPDFEALATAAGRTLRIVPFEADGTCHASPDGAEVLFRYFPADRSNTARFGTAEFRRLIQAAPALRWVQTNSSGVDYLTKIPEIYERDLIVTNGSSVNQWPMAETVMGLLLGVTRRIPQHVRHQLQHEWQRYQKLELRGSTVLIVGYGHIGAEVGRLCEAFGMRVLAVRKRVSEPSPHAAAVYGPEQLPEALAEADFVVLVAATTPNQRPLIGASELAVMKETAWLVNVGRGVLVDDAALIPALESGQIAGAALDVFTQEPLPPEHPYWDMPNVLITPHNSASSPRQDERTLQLFVENFRRWLADEPLLNRVDIHRGY